MSKPNAAQSLCRRFLDDESGAITVQFVIVFPVFMTLFLMTFESGMINAHHVMLERGVDIAVRDVRIGTMPNPTRNTLRERICEVARIIPNCMTQLEIELIQLNPTGTSTINSAARCIDRGDVNQNPDVDFSTQNNELVILRACVRIDPFLPLTGIGAAIVENNSGGAAGGSYALISLGAFVVEPFRAES